MQIVIGLSSKQKVIVIGLFIIGGFILANGGLKISLAGGDILNDAIVVPTVVSGLIQGHVLTNSTLAASTISEVRDVEASFTTSIDHNDGETTGKIYTVIKLKTREAWTADNEIRYTIASAVEGTDKVSDIFFVTVMDASRYFDDIPEIKYNDFKKQYEGEGLIQLKETELPNVWAKKGNFTMPIKSNLAFFGGYGIENSGYHIATETIVELESPSVKIQADASRALIQQVNESKKTNDIIEGLTWILISVIPIGFGFEIILREYYHNKQKSRTHMEFLR